MTKKSWYEERQEFHDAAVDLRQALIEAFQLERILGWFGMELKEKYRKREDRMEG